MNIQEILNILSHKFNNGNINWLEASEISFDGNELKISFLNPFIYAWFRENIHAALKLELGEKRPAIKLVVSPPLRPIIAASRSKRSEPFQAKSPEISNMDYFADFIYNEKNALAVKAALSLAQKQIPENFPFLILFYGPSGSGKSHLLKAIHQKRLAQGETNCLFFSVGELLRRPINILDYSRDRGQGSSVLIIDDLNYLDDSPSAASLVSALCDIISEKERGDFGRKNIRLAAAITAEGRSDNHISDRLRSRLEQGLYFELQAADLDIRLRCAEKFNREKKLGLNRGVLVQIARQSNRFTDTMGHLRKIEYFSRAQGRTPSLRDVDQLIGEKSSAPPLDWQRILENVSKRLNLKTEDILGSKRKPDCVLARQIAMFLARSRLALSFQEIGRLFGGKDHSTVMHSVRKIEKLRGIDEDMRKLLADLEK